MKPITLINGALVQGVATDVLSDTCKGQKVVLRFYLQINGS